MTWGGYYFYDPGIMETTAKYAPRRGRPKGWRKGLLMQSKMMLQRGRDARALRSSIEVFKGQAAAGLDERLAAELAEGESLPDHALSLELVGRSVQSAFDRLRAAEWRYLDEQRRCKIIRRGAESLARREVNPRLVAVRRSIDAQFGKQGGFEVHGMKGKTLRKARRLHGQLEYVVQVLADRDWELPAPLLEGMKVNRQVWLSQLESGYEQLTALVDELGDCELREKHAHDLRDAAMKEFDVAFGEALRLVQATYVFAGCHDKLAKNLRSYWRRRLLSRRAREARQARAEGRLRTPGEVLRSAASSVMDWLGPRRPPSVA